MKEKISLKRQSRRCKSESAKESSGCSNNNGKLIKEGKEVCAIPRIDCCCPDQAVIQDDPEQSVKMSCSNLSCPYSSNAYVHMECFKALENEMYKLLKHLGHKTSNWTDTQIRQNLWDRKGLTLIQTELRCPCNRGISLRDEDAWVLREKEAQKIEKKRKSKNKNLPTIINRVRCESENAPPQYDSHDDEIINRNLSTRGSKIRFENAKSKKSSKKTSTFKLEKSPEVEFPEFPGCATRRTTSLCEPDVKKSQFPPYSKVVSNGVTVNMNVKPVEKEDTSGSDIDWRHLSSKSNDFDCSRSKDDHHLSSSDEGQSDFNKAPGTNFNDFAEMGTQNSSSPLPHQMPLYHNLFTSFMSILTPYGIPVASFQSMLSDSSPKPASTSALHSSLSSSHLDLPDGSDDHYHTADEEIDCDSTDENESKKKDNGYKLF